MLETFQPAHLGHASTVAGKRLDLEPSLCMIFEGIALKSVLYPYFEFGLKT